MSNSDAASFGGRRAIITGGAAGLGLATARLLAKGGASVVLSDINAEACAAAAEALRAEGVSAHSLPCDLGLRAASEQMIAEGVARLGGLDILVHNAGMFPAGLIDEIAFDQIEKTIAVNLSACFWLTRAALPALRLSPAGRILVTSSVAGNRCGLAGLIHYGATKAGVNGFIRCAAVEFGPLGITVNGVDGPDPHREVRPGRRGDRRDRSGHSGGAARTTADIAEAMAFLASDKAQWITGQTIVVDGGGSLPKPSPFAPSGMAPRSKGVPA